MYGSFLSWDQWAALLGVLRLPGVRYGCLVLSVPLSVAGRLLLPPQPPALTATALLQDDLGPVAAGLFLSAAGMAGAIGYLLGTVARAFNPPQGQRPAVALTLVEMALGLGAIATTLLIAGRALSWAAASCLVLAACGGLWGVNRTLPPSVLGSGEHSVPGEPSQDEGGSVFDQWER